MTLDFIRCECGKAHLRGARYCDECGAQPPRRKGTGRAAEDWETDGEREDYVSCVIALSEALVGTNGKWGVA